jgi:alkylated DNA repair protein alkB family protein 8
MRGIKVKGLSCLRTLVSDGESHVQPMPLVEEETGSSSSVQYTPEIEKNYVHLQQELHDLCLHKF